MKKKIYAFTAMAFLFFFIPSIYASPAEWKVDPAHSGIYFGIKHIYSTVKGFFPEFEGNITFDPANLKESRVTFNVTVKSIDTNNGKPDGHLLSAEFFDAKKYPAMSFESKSITRKQGDQYVAEGVMKIKDVSKTIQMPFTFFGTRPHPFNPKQEVAGFEAKMTIDRLAYNVGNGKYVELGVVGKDVDILVSLEATKAK